jgi:hypothetical protein
MENQLFGHPIEIMAFTRGQSEGNPVALFEFRPHPEESRGVVGLMLTQEQCIRIRDTMNEFLNRRDSWLYLSKAAQRAMKIQEDDNE